jgi:hypothetical protein
MNRQNCEHLLTTMPTSSIPEIQEEIQEIHNKMKNAIRGNQFFAFYASYQSKIPDKIISKLSIECRDLFKKGYANGDYLIEHNPWEDPRCKIERQLRRIEGAWKGIQATLHKEKEDRIRREKEDHIRREKEDHIRKVDEFQKSLESIREEHSKFNRDIVDTYHQLGQLQDYSIKDTVIEYRSSLINISDTVGIFIENTYKMKTRLNKYKLGNTVEGKSDYLDYCKQYIKDHMKWFQEKVKANKIVREWMGRMFKIQRDKSDIIQKEYNDKISKLEKENKSLKDKIKWIDKIDIKILL